MPPIYWRTANSKLHFGRTEKGFHSTLPITKPLFFTINSHHFSWEIENMPEVLYGTSNGSHWSEHSTVPLHDFCREKGTQSTSSACGGKLCRKIPLAANQWRGACSNEYQLKLQQRAHILCPFCWDFCWYMSEGKL